MPGTLELTAGAAHLLLDTTGWTALEGLTWRAHPPRPAGVALAPERPWEEYRIAPLAVIEDDGMLKLWYSAIACHAGTAADVVCPRCARPNPGTKVVCIACGWPLVDIDYLQQSMFGVAYAESRDGVHWERPDLGLVDFRGSRHNNLVRGACGVPARNPKGGPAQRFMGLVEHQRELYVTFSSDGWHWQRQPRPCLPFGADTNNQLIYDPETDRYVALLRGFPGRRTTVYCEVADLQQTPWPFVDHGHQADSTGYRYLTDELPTALDVDAADPPLPGLDLNHVSASRLGPRTWLGFPALFRKYPPAGLDRAGRETHRYFAQGNDGTWETQLAVSRDGRTWQRPDRSAYLGPGLWGGPDGGINSLYGVGLVRRGDEMLQFGSGQSVTHGIFEPGERRGVGAIYGYTQPVDRFMAAVAGIGGGRLLSEPLTWPGGDLVLNCDCGGLGQISAELRGVDHTPLPGFAHADCDRVDLNQLAAVVTWRGQTTQTVPVGQCLRLDLRLESTRLYALTCRPPQPRPQ
jgi:hypothetical protein